MYWTLPRSEATDKIFTIEMKDSLKQVSVDRLKVAHLPVSTDSSAYVHSFVASIITTHSGRVVGLPARFLD